jgi:hypothetical protein
VGRRTHQEVINGLKPRLSPSEYAAECTPGTAGQPRYRRRTGSKLKVEGLLKLPSFAEARFEGSPEGVMYDKEVRDRARDSNYGDIGPK